MTFHPANRLQDLCEVKRESVSARSASTGTRLSERMIAICGVDYIRFSPLARPSPVAAGLAYLQRAHRHTARFGLSGLVSFIFGAGRVMSQMGTPPIACRGSTLAGSIRQTRAKASYSPNAQPSPETGRVVTDPSSFFTTERSRSIPCVAYPKCPVVMAFITFAFCLPVMCLIVWLVYRGLAN